MKIQVWNIADLQTGLKTFEYEENVAITLVWAGPWGSSKNVMVLGNPDCGQPTSYFIDCEKNTMSKAEEYNNFLNKPTIVEDAIIWDAKRGTALLEEQGHERGKCLAYYNLKQNRTEFGKQCKEYDHLFNASPD